MSDDESSDDESLDEELSEDFFDGDFFGEDLPELLDDGRLDDKPPDDTSSPGRAASATAIHAGRTSAKPVQLELIQPDFLMPSPR